MTRVWKAAAITLIAYTGFAAQAAVLVDDFSVGQTFLKDSTTNALGLSNTVSGASILGGWRDLYVSKYGNIVNDPTLRGVEIGVDPALPGTLSFSTDSGQRGVGIVRWDGPYFDGFVSIDPVGLGGVNLASQGAGLEVIVTSADLNFPFTINAYTNAANWTSLTLMSSGPGIYFLPFAAFTTVGVNTGTGVDFSSLGALEAILDTGGSVIDVDLQIDLVRPLSEPASAGLAGIALIGLWGLSSSRRRARRA